MAVITLRLSLTAKPPKQAPFDLDYKCHGGISLRPAGKKHQDPAGEPPIREIAKAIMPTPPVIDTVARS